MRESVRQVVAEVLAGVQGLSVRRREQLADAVTDALCARLFDLDLLAATERSIAQARTDGTITGAHDGVVTALLQLARRIDLAEPYFDELADHYAERKLRPPSPDNVSVPTYLKYATSLGLTPAKRMPAPAKGGGRSSGGGLASRRQAELNRQRSRHR